jgi:hypothetical protein
MSYITERKVIIQVEDSEALDQIVYDAERGIIGVTYLSNPDFTYEHENCISEDLDRLKSLIWGEGSATRGYNAWKDERKAELQAHDQEMFERYWTGLNEYQRENFYQWAREKLLSDPNRNLPIYMRQQRQPKVTWHPVKNDR